MTKKVCIIPARMASSRFPGKPMKKLMGLPIINHIFRRCRLYENFDQIIVATCDEEIKQSIESDGGLAIMTSDSHERCTDRIEEALRKSSIDLSDEDFILMVQGDEIFIDPEIISSMVDAYEIDKPPIVNAVSPLPNQKDCEDINTVKVVCDLKDNVLFMTRSPIPSQARVKHSSSLQQTGIIGFKKSFLHQYSSMEQTPMEKIESVDMLRVIENGYKIKAIRIPRETIGIDTPEDFKNAELLLKDDPFVSHYL